MDLMDKSNVAHIEVDELAPGESAVIELNIKDLWKSVYEQYIGTEERYAHRYRNLIATHNRIDMIGDYLFNSFYERALSEMPVEHILKNVSVSFAGSDMTVPYEIKIIDNGIRYGSFIQYAGQAVHSGTVAYLKMTIVFFRRLIV